MKHRVMQGLAVTVIILCIGMSVVLSTIGLAEDKSSNNNLLESANNPKDGLLCDHPAYIIGDGPDCYLYEFILNNASNLNCVCEGSSGGFSSATWSSDNYIYCVDYVNGLLIIIDIDSWEMWSIDVGGETMIGLAYNLNNGLLYASSVNNYLYGIDPDTGEQDQIGPFGGSVQYMVGMAFDAEGTLYGWDLGNDALWIIDIETGEATQVGSLGINIDYACDGDFCKEDDLLYIVYENNLLMFDKEIGECKLNGKFPDYVSVTGLAIPYEDDDITPPEIELHWEAYTNDEIWYISFNATCFDNESGMNRVEFFYNGILQDIIFGPGPIYKWELKFETESYSLKGFICHRRATEENVSFFALIVWNTVDYNFDLGDIVEAYAYDNAGNWNYDDAFDTFWSPGMPYFLKHFSFYNQYKGYIGRFLISAEFENEPYGI